MVSFVRRSVIVIRRAWTRITSCIRAPHASVHRVHPSYMQPRNQLLVWDGPDMSPDVSFISEDSYGAASDNNLSWDHTFLWDGPHVIERSLPSGADTDDGMSGPGEGPVWMRRREEPRPSLFGVVQRWQGEGQGADGSSDNITEPSPPLKEACRRWEALRCSICNGEDYNSWEHAKEFIKATTVGSTYSVGYGGWNGILMEFEMTMIPKGMAVEERSVVKETANKSNLVPNEIAAEEMLLEELRRWDKLTDVDDDQEQDRRNAMQRFVVELDYNPEDVQVLLGAAYCATLHRSWLH